MEHRTKKTNKGNSKQTLKPWDRAMLKKTEEDWDSFCETALLILANRDWSTDLFPTDMSRLVMEEYARSAFRFYHFKVADAWDKELKKRFSNPADRDFLFNNIFSWGGIDIHDHFEQLSRGEQKKWIRWGAEGGLHLVKESEYYERCQKRIVDDIKEFLDQLMERSDSVRDAWQDYMTEVAQKVERWAGKRKTVRRKDL